MHTSFAADTKALHERVAIIRLIKSAWNSNSLLSTAVASIRRGKLFSVQPFLLQISMLCVRSFIVCCVVGTSLLLALLCVALRASPAFAYLFVSVAVTCDFSAFLFYLSIHTFTFTTQSPTTTKTYLQIKMLVLKEADIKKSLPIKEALEVNKDAFIQQASESAIVPERIQIPTPKYSFFLIYF
jgi:hypothetical protein